MPSTYYDSDVSGSGSASLGGSAVIYVSADLITVPTLARGLVDADEWIRAGWWALGDNFDIGLGTFDYWGPKHFFDFEHNVWSPTPNQDPGNSLNFTTTATRIRWQIGPDGLAHLHVFGF
jgi:hypothetical protein